MTWWDRLLGKPARQERVEEDRELEEARLRRRHLMSRLVVLGIEADVILGDRSERRNRRRGDSE